jgi:acetyltransferase-like isoleucine patch superfamily enzyme
MIFDHRLFDLYIAKRKYDGQPVPKSIRFLSRFLRNRPAARFLGGIEVVVGTLLALPIPVYRTLVQVTLTYLPGSPNLAGNYLRALYYRRRLKRMGANTIIEEGVRIHNPDTVELDEFVLIDKNTVINTAGLRVGKRSHICYGVMLLGSERVEIGDYCAVSHGAMIITSTEVPRDGARMSSTMVPFEQRVAKREPVVIKKDGFVGAAAVVMPGVIVEEGGVIGAGMVTFENIGPWEIRYGKIPGEVRSKKRDKVRFGEID